MGLFRRLSILSRRNPAARAGLLAFEVALCLGVGLGFALGKGADRAATRKATGDIREALQVRNSLDRGLRSSWKALHMLAGVPSVTDPQGAEKQAFSRFLGLYPQFSSVGLVKPPRASRLLGGAPEPPSLSVGIPKTDRWLYAALDPDWPQALIESEGFGRGRGGAFTLLQSRQGLLTRSSAGPSWSDLQGLPDGAVATLPWSDGQSYLTGVRRVELNLGKGDPYAVVTGVPESVIALGAHRGKRAGMGFGIFLGLVGGAAAWIGIARSTRRLRALNDALEGRVTARTAELQAAERSFRGIFENVPLGLYQCDPEGRFLRANPTLAATLGFADPEALIAGLGSLQTIGGLEARAAFLRRLRAEGEVRGTTTLAVRTDGRPVWLAESARAVRGANGEILLIEGAMHDVTAQRELEEALRQIGATDPLTGLLNRRGLEEAVGAAEMPVSFVALDLDGFKGFNDTYGHPAGDRALQTVAAALRAAVPAGGAVARAGGEEFVVVLSRTGADAARRLAEGMREAVAEADVIETRLTLSGGVATATTREAVAEAFAAADRALYLAKEAGRNRIVANLAALA